MSKAVVISTDVADVRKVDSTPLELSKQTIDLPPTPVKRVILSWVNGQWTADVELNDITRPFTERDFNQLDILLRVQRHRIRRQTSLAYRQLLATNASKLPVVEKPLVV